MQFKNINAEMIVIGKILSNNEEFFRIINLKPEHFSEPLLGKVFEYVTKNIIQGKSIILESLRGVFDDEAIRILISCEVKAIGVFNINAYSDLVIKNFQYRFFVEKTKEPITLETNLAELMEEIRAGIDGDATYHRLRNEQQVAKDIYDDLHKDLPCYSTGLKLLDGAMAGGVYETFFYCFAARQKVGKTIMLATLSDNFTKNKIPHLFVAAEMGVNEILKRNISHHIGVNSVAFYNEGQRKTKAFQERVGVYATKASETTFFADTPAISLDVLVSLIITTVKKHKVKIVIIDYLQIVQGKFKNESEAEFQGRVAQRLADLAKSLKVAIITAAQLNRDGKLRGSDGIINAVEQLYFIQKGVELVKGGKKTQTRYLTLEASRITNDYDLGDENNPSLYISQYGPFIKDLERSEFYG